MTLWKAFCLIFLLLLGAWVYSMEKGPHAFTDSECVNCHTKDSSGKVTKQMKMPIAMLCKKCHEKIFSGEGYVHPFNVRPTFTVPADLPLSPEGEITCATCHNIHSPVMTPSGTKSYFLRRIGPRRQFCEACHKGGVGTGSHRAALGEAHFSSKYIVTDSSRLVDPMSRECISCHDGTFSTSVTVAVGRWRHGREFIKFDEGEHPIGMDYEQARTRAGGKSDLRPIDTVDPRIRFFGGKVGCGSCHDPYSTIEKKLVMSDRGSRLCFACHAMEM